ncbi:type II CRISPR-associated endonuclease Cas1 [Corynebacterium sp. HS2168-gen11]|uniref:type II CRISPR-associated endonuclease Cas1 n=1 Tax=Corynebacterium sp. HS2168-gen11 TaxID=2974027 RepID=UPI00216B35CA|nr:type II CRISPR-associated endonuclease Cas1 [Corynebacterium sp. HS2168-gen11]MCS4535311.1 type II CRISPR-associated endonuclease Cas1 [Corynebacterium sp. HS2168-gen11]
MNNYGWQVLDFTGFTGLLRYKRGNLLVVHESQETQELPLINIAIVLIGNSVSVSGAVLTKLSELDIALIVCDWKKVPTAIAAPFGDHTRIGARQQAQADLSLPRRKRAWSNIIKAKVSGQACTLRSLGYQDGYASLQALKKSINSGDSHNIEAQAARKYWSTISGSHMFSRVPGIGTDRWNSALDYGYTILRGHGIRALTAAGLIGTLGVFHHGRSNAFALVDDLMEPFRPALDEFVFSNFEQSGVLEASHKHALVEAFTLPFTKTGQTIPTVFEDFAQAYGAYVEDTQRILEVPHWIGSNHAQKR